MMSNTSDNTTIENGDSSSAGTKRSIPIDSGFCKRACNRMYLQEETADIHFTFNGNGGEERVPAHKLMLSSGSPVFHSMFYGNLKEEGDVCMTDCRIESFKEFLQFFYLADVTLTMKNVAEVMNLVNKYDAMECFPICEQFVLQNFSMQIACWALELALVFNRIEFRQSLLKKMMEAPNELFATDSFKSCTPDILKVILRCQQANCRETSFFKACIDWATNACIDKLFNPLDMIHIRQQLGDCLYLIQFAAMSRPEISECIARYSDLFSKDELIDIIAVMATAEADDNTKLKYFPHKTRIKYVQGNNNVIVTLSTIDSTQSDLKLSEVAGFMMNKKVVIGAVATHIVQAKTNMAAGKINGLMDICVLQRERDNNIQRSIYKQPVVVFVGALDGRSLFIPRNLIELNRPITIEKGLTYAIKFEFESSNWIGGEFTTKKSEKSQKISMHDYIVTGKFGFISHLYFIT